MGGWHICYDLGDGEAADMLCNCDAGEDHRLEGMSRERNHMKPRPVEYGRVVQRYDETLPPADFHILRDERPGRQLREHYANHLRDCYADERLTRAEMEARCGAAAAARTIGELAELVRDLPRPPRPKGRSPWKRLGALTRLVILLFCMAGAVALIIVPWVLLTSYHAPISIGAPVITCSVLAGIVWLVISIILIVIDKDIQEL